MTKLLKQKGKFQWPGFTKIRCKRLTDKLSHVYEVINPLLRIESFMMRKREIDTPDDYENAVNWFINGCNE